MAFQRKFNGPKKDGLSSGAFKSKSGEVYVAKFNGEWFAKLIKIVKEAAQQEQPGLVLFIRKNDKRKSEKDPQLKVSVAVDKPFKKNAIKMSDSVSESDGFGDDDADTDSDVSFG
jgi:hypothetical protein